MPAATLQGRARKVSKTGFMAAKCWLAGLGVFVGLIAQPLWDAAAVPEVSYAASGSCRTAP